MNVTGLFQSDDRLRPADCSLIGSLTCSAHFQLLCGWIRGALLS